MIGVNKMTFCVAQMKEIVQHYFDTVLFKDGQSPQVVSVSSENNYGDVIDFHVGVSDAKKPEAQ